MKVVICWAGVSGYLTACWRALAAKPGIDLRLVVFPTVGMANAPFPDGLLQGLPAEPLDAARTTDAAHVAEHVAAHRPDVLVVPGWWVPAFRALATDARLASARLVIAIDTPLKRGVKDAVRQRLAKWKLKPLLARADRIIVPGERSWQYAKLLGFAESQIRRGTYGFDAAAFASAYEQRLAAGPWPRSFLFVGRYVPSKGVATLLEAYATYRTAVTDPWPLTCCGSGPLASAIAATPGARDAGFVQPADQPAEFARHGAFVLSSHYEPWGVAIGEAMASGLPAICTEACGASVELVRPYYNGLLAATADAASLAGALRWTHDHADRLPEMGRRAREFAAAYSAQAWADRWAAMFEELMVQPR